MAKIFKIEGYYVDPNGDWSAEWLKTELEENYDLASHHIKVQERDIGEWDDDLPINNVVCGIGEFEKYFKE